MHFLSSLAPSACAKWATSHSRNRVNHSLLLMGPHGPTLCWVLSSGPEEPILPSKSALSMLSKPVKSSVDEKKSYMSLAKQMFLGSVRAPARSLFSLALHWSLPSLHSALT
jgi:hypothetical protein